MGEVIVCSSIVALVVRILLLVWYLDIIKNHDGKISNHHE